MKKTGKYITPTNVLLVFIVFMLAIAIHIFDSKLKSIKKNLKYLQRDVKKLEYYVLTPTIEGLQTKTIGDQTCKLVPYDIKFSKELDYFEKKYKNIVPSFKVEPYSLGKDKAIEFHPKQWGARLISLSHYAERENQYTSVKGLISTYIEQGKANSIKSETARYFSYPFEYELFDRIFSPPWHSAIAQGYCLAAFAKLYEIEPVEEHRNLLLSAYNSFTQIRKTGDQTEPWISFIDENQFLWFEEFPHTEEPQFRVLNGHIYAIMGLYSYYRVEPNEVTLTLIRAGITTVQRYFNNFRNPNGINNYCMLENSKWDYKPSRSIIQMQWLADITNDPSIRSQADAFKSDMGP